MHTNKEPLFSIVMPVYGVERYIADAVADALVQTDGDFELILVDDCSPDRSIEVALAVAGDDPRVRIVRHSENRGLSAARNSGIDAARGTWITFPDPDDRFEGSLLAQVHRTIIESSPDVVMFGHADDYYDGNGAFLYRQDVPLDAGTFSRGPALALETLALEKQTNLGYAWNKLFKLDTIRKQDLRFEDDAPLIEDLVFTMAYLQVTQTLSLVPDTLYFYKKRLESNLTSKFVPNYFALHKRRIRLIRDFMEDNGALDDKALATLGALYGRFIMSSIERNASTQAGMTRKQQAQWLETLFEDDLFCELIPHAKAENSRALALSLNALKAQNISALLAIGNVIHIVRTHNTGLYMKAKSHR